MKKQYIFLASILLSFSAAYTQQAINNDGYSGISWLETYQGAITIGSDTWQQKFEASKDEPCELRITQSITDKKGRTEETQYIFNLADIDKNTVKFEVSGKSIEVILVTLLQQKFITVYTDGELQDYKDEMHIITNEVDHAQEMVNLFKEKIPECKKEMTIWNSYDEAINWINKNVGEVTLEEDKYTQEFKADPNNKHMISYKKLLTYDKGEITENIYTFNLTDIDASNVILNISGKTISALLPVKEKKDYIAVQENGTKDNYEKEIEILTGDINTARNLINALKYAIPLVKAPELKLSTVEDGLNFLTKNLGTIEHDGTKIEKKFSYLNKGKDITTLVVKEIEEDGSETEIIYEFYLSEIDPASLNMDVSGDEVHVEMSVKDNLKLIRTKENGSIENNENEIELMINDIEMARDIIESLKYILQNLNPGLQNWSSSDQFFQWFSENISDVTVDGLTISQSINYEKSKDQFVKIIQVLNEGGEAKENVYEFYLPDLDPEAIELEVRGKQLEIAFETKGKNKHIRHYENGALENYSSDFTLYHADSRFARNIISGFKYCVPANAVVIEDPKSITEAQKIISDLLTEVNDESTSYEQEYKIVEGDACKISFNIITSDDKGSEDELYEFNLADLDAALTKFDVSGKIFEITLETKNKQKLIKPYSNGEAGNFTQSFKFYTDDVQKARKLVSAIRYSINNCQ